MANIEPVATLRTCYPEKFATPRQSGLAPAAWGIVEFMPAHRQPDGLRGIEEHSHLWLITQFHQVPQDHVATTVRPPRLGGNERVGVFATRSPFRPNRLALSVVKLERVEWHHPLGPRLHVSGIDMVDGTPVFDVKPYVPYADCVPAAISTMANDAPVRCELLWDCAAPVDDSLRSLIEQSVSLSPQPAYQDDERGYAATIAGHTVRWRIVSGVARIQACEPQNPACTSTRSSSAWNPGMSAGGG
jgi:tRNA (adenine37-N6)-methyltransferase